MPSSSKMPARRAAVKRAEFRKAKKRGVIVVEDRSPEAARKATEESRRTGKIVRYLNGTDRKRTDPEKLQAIMERVKAKSEMTVIALRLPTADTTPLNALPSDTASATRPC